MQTSSTAVGGSVGEVDRPHRHVRHDGIADLPVAHLLTLDREGLDLALDEAGRDRVESLGAAVGPLEHLVARRDQGLGGDRDRGLRLGLVPERRRRREGQ